ncbi:hypothetical protein SERLA73DRAFT_151625 [Serpula lacrymans var. lacrymans S7.3]|uniref:PH domain-containing protein n=1 Tax=Serpula lacrymans var. lacrymans (strain S7.3) TaxID=936435 RepID=F8PTR9_SERL3|nr:hypothetical protein SERLA73DRAFT_151625 [Serpula lacrymans var. lacrymans S7.3]
MSPSRDSYTYSSVHIKLISGKETPVASSDSDGATSARNMRRVLLSPSGSADSYTYSEENSVEETAEVEATLNELDEEIDSTEAALTQWSRGPSSSFVSGSYTGTTPSRTSTSLTPYSMTEREHRVLSTISERTENMPSRPTSYLLAGGAQRPANPTPEAHRYSAQRGGAISPAPSHSRSSTDPGSDRGPAPPTGRRFGDLIAFFEDKTTTFSETSYSHSRATSAPGGYRSPSPLFTQSQSTPNLGTNTGYGVGTTTGYSSRPSSPAKSKAGSSVSSSASEPLSMSSLLAPPTRGPTSTSTGSRGIGTSTYMSPSEYTNTFTNTFTNSGSNTFTTSRNTGTQSSGVITPTNSSLRRPQTSPRSPLTSVRNIVAAWKERTPTLDKSGKPTRAAPTSTPRGEGLFSLRKRAERGENRLRGMALSGNLAAESSRNNHGHPSTPRSVRSGSSGIPPPFDMAELGAYARNSQEPLRIGLLWYLNVHSAPPFRWQRCEALLYPNMLLLSWIAPGGGRGVVTLDLLNCTEVRSVPSPTHSSAREDVGTMAAKTQAEEKETPALMELLCPFQLLYSDGVERLAAESARERVRWVSAIWEALDRSVTLPNRSEAFLYPGDPRVIGPSRSSSLRRTSSMTDLDEEFATAVSRARSARPGLGFGLSLVGGTLLGDGSPVTVSSGPRLGGDVRVTPPPSSRGGKSRPHSEMSDDAFFSAGSRTSSSDPNSNSSNFYSVTSTSSSGQDRTTTGLVTDGTMFGITSGGSNTEIVPSTLSYRRTESASLLGDSHDGSYSYTPTSPSRTSLSRSAEVRRRGFSSRGYTTYDETSDKENSGSYTPWTTTRSTLSSFTRSRSITPTPSSSNRSAVEELAQGETSRTSSGSEGYETAGTPSTASFKSLPTIPSESDYSTAELCKTEASTEYVTAEKCASDVSTDYITADVCKTEVSSEYITAEVCKSEPSTQFETASLCRTIPSEAESPFSIHVDIPIEADVPPIIPPVVSSPVVSLSDEQIEYIEETVVEENLREFEEYVEREESIEEDFEIIPENIPLPPSGSSPSLSASGSLESEQISVPAPSSVVHTNSVSLSFPSSITPQSDNTRLQSMTPVSSLTESSPLMVSDGLTPSAHGVPELSISTPSVRESMWAPETDMSFNSSVLHPSPSVQSVQMPEGLDTSFDTSFMRPSISPLTSLERLTPITETMSSSLSFSPSPVPHPALPPSISSPTSAPTPVIVSTSMESSSLSRTASSVSDVSIVSITLSPDVEQTSLPSPAMVPLPSSPAPSFSAASVSMSVSMSTPQSNNPSIHSDLDTIPTQPRSEILTHDINRLLQHIHELDQIRGQESQEISENVRAIRSELYELSNYLHQHEVSEVPPPVPHKDHISSSSPSPGPSLSRSSSSPTQPPPSPTPSSASSSTARPVEGMSLINLRELLEQLREQTTALWDGQVSTNHMLDELRQQRPGPQDNDEIYERLRGIESLLERVIDQTQIHRQPMPMPQPQPQPPQPDISASVSESGSDPLADLESLRIRWEELSRSRREQIPIHMPTPVRTGPSLDDQLLELLGAPPPLPPAHPQLPPTLIPFTYQPAPRASRSRSTSPILMPDRPRTVPFTREEPVNFSPTRIRRVRTVRRPPPAGQRRPVSATEPSEMDTPRIIPARPPFAQADIGRQEERRPRVPPAYPVIPNLYATPPPARAPSAPANFDNADDPRVSASWYRERPSGPGGIVPPPGAFDGQPGTQPGGLAYVPMPAGPTVVQVPLFDTLMEILREHRLAQLATVDQQRELMRYMRGLNEWLERDVSDRQSELRGVSARVDQLRNELAQLGLGFRPDMPQPQHSSGPFIVPPVPPVTGPMGQPHLVSGQYPGGFVPLGPMQGGLVPPVIAQDRTPTPSYTPVIPSPVMGMPGVHHVPVVPDFSSYTPHHQVQGPDHYVYEPSAYTGGPSAYTGGVIPSPQSDSATYEPMPAVIINPPPPQIQQQQQQPITSTYFVPPSPSHSRSGSTTSTQQSYDHPPIPIPPHSGQDRQEGLADAPQPPVPAADLPHPSQARQESVSEPVTTVIINQAPPPAPGAVPGAVPEAVPGVVQGAAPGGTLPQAGVPGQYISPPPAIIINPPLQQIPGGPPIVIGRSPHSRPSSRGTSGGHPTVIVQRSRSSSSSPRQAPAHIVITSSGGRHPEHDTPYIDFPTQGMFPQQADHMKDIAVAMTVTTLVPTPHAVVTPVITRHLAGPIVRHIGTGITGMIGRDRGLTLPLAVVGVLADTIMDVRVAIHIPQMISGSGTRAMVVALVDPGVMTNLVMTRKMLGSEIQATGVAFSGVHPGDTYIPDFTPAVEHPPESEYAVPHPHHTGASHGIPPGSVFEDAPRHRPISETSVVPIPVPHVQTGPGDLAFEDALRDHHQRLDDAEKQLTEVAHQALENEDRREDMFRQNEDERERVFLGNETRREQESQQRADEIFRHLEERVAGIPLPPSGPAAAEPAPSIIESLHSAAQDAASRHASDILDTVRLEREELIREREAAEAERQRYQAEMEAERSRLDAEREARIQALEEELAKVRGELENEKQMRVTEEADMMNRERQEAQDRDDGLRNQLSDITNIVQEQRDTCDRENEARRARWEEDDTDKRMKNELLETLRSLASKLVDDADKKKEEEERAAAEGKPGIEEVMEELRRQSAEQRELLMNLSENKPPNRLPQGWRSDSNRQHEETINAVRATAQEQVPFNVQGYLDEFSKALASEVRMLLGEVGKLREERRNMQHEIGFLLSMRAKYAPGGEFDPEWKPPATGPPADAPPPEPPAPPEEPAPARPAWRTVTQRTRKIRKRQEAAPPAQPPAPDPRQQVTSWATWHPDPALAPTPPSIEANLIVPDRGSPGLFGPRSPRDSYR